MYYLHKLILFILGTFIILAIIMSLFSAEIAQSLIRWSLLFLMPFLIIWLMFNTAVFLYFKLFYHATELKNPQYIHFLNAVNKLFHADVFHIYVIKQHRPQAYCFTAGKSQIYITDYLMGELKTEEILFILGHELGHAFTRQSPLVNNKKRRMEEFKADAFGLLVTQDLPSAISALDKMDQLYIEGKFKFTGNYHPTTEERIHALKSIDNYMTNRMSS